MAVNVMRVVSILVVGFGVMCMAMGAWGMALVAYEDGQPLLLIIAAVAALVMVWWIRLLWRLITGRQPQKAVLFGRVGWLIAAVVVALLPVAGLFTGHYRGHGVLPFIQAGVYWLMAWAFYRKGRPASDGHKWDRQADLPDEVPRWRQ